MKNSPPWSARTTVNFTGPLSDETSIKLIDQIRALRNKFFR